MASPPVGNKSIFEQLNEHDPKFNEEKDKTATERMLRQNEEAQQRLARLVDSNSTLPCTIHSVQVLNATHTRKGFLRRVFEPILRSNDDQAYTLSETLGRISLATEKLHKFDIFHQPIATFIDKSNPTDSSTTPTDLDVYLSVKEKSRILARTGTEVGNVEGAAYANLVARNLFGGAESLSLYGGIGTRTRSTYSGTFDTPLLSNPDLKLEIGGLASATQKVWANHEEVLKEGWTKLRYMTPGGHKHELAYNGAWRQLTGLGKDASETVRGDAGDSMKSSLVHTWVSDSRDYPLLPTRGLYMKTVSELAGWGPLQGDVAFWKSELEAQTAIPVALPGVKNSGISFTSGVRAGLLYPLVLHSDSTPQPSRINDRFQLGGPADVRGFRLSGLGPRDGGDAVGGDVYAAASANILFPLPRIGPDRPFRLQAFINGGRLLALKSPEKESRTASNAVHTAVRSTVAELGNGLPSIAAGVGLVYAHPAARLELNFSLPLVLRKGEEGRKGLQFGIGINLL